MLFPIGWVRDFVRLGLDVIEARLPFKLSTGISLQPPKITVTLINQTKDMPLHVHRVGIHFGTRWYNYFFVLEPCESVTIAPKDRKEFCLSFGETKIGRRTLYKELPKLNPNSMPTFDSPADLFKAIARGSTGDSWIEIDFNEFTGRRFRRGKVKPLFSEVINQGRNQLT